MNSKSYLVIKYFIYNNKLQKLLSMILLEIKGESDEKA